MAMQNGISFVHVRVACMDGLLQFEVRVARPVQSDTQCIPSAASAGGGGTLLVSLKLLNP